MAVIPFGRPQHVGEEGSWREKVWCCRLDSCGSECGPVVGTFDIVMNLQSLNTFCPFHFGTSQIGGNRSNSQIMLHLI